MKKYMLLRIALFVLASVLLGFGVFDRMKISKVLYTESAYLHDRVFDWETNWVWRSRGTTSRLGLFPGSIEAQYPMRPASLRPAFRFSKYALSLGKTDVELARLGANLHGRLCSLDRMRRIRKAMQKYEKDHGESVPLYSRDEQGNPLHSWRVLLLPYLAEMSTGASRVPYDQIRLDEPWYSEWNSQFRNRVPEVYRGGRASGAATGFSLLIPEDSDHSSWLIERNDFVEWMNPKADVSVDEILDPGFFLAKARINPGRPRFKLERYVRNDTDAMIYEEHVESLRDIDDFPEDKTFWLTTPTREYCVSPDCDGQKIIEALFQNPVE
ncbi:MAG: hypothetical protein IKS14_06305 [Thermoguttaceae bacterium]|nr:hypothetical protein [Thermoguttaceae bacterium]